MCLIPRCLFRRLSAKRVVRVSAEEKDVEADVKTAEEPAATGGTFYNDERPVSGQDLVWVEIACRIACT